MFPWNKVIEKKALLEIVDNDLSFLDSVIELFKQQSSDTMTDMKAALRVMDQVALGRAVHDLKNIGRSVGSTPLIEQSMRLEEIVAMKQLNIVNRQLKKIEKLLLKAQKELINIRGK